MSSLTIIIDSLGPVALVISLGFLAGRLGVFQRETGASFAKFALTIGLPALLFNSIATMTIAELHDWRFFLGLSLGLVIVYLVSIIWSIKVLRKPIGESSLNALCSAFPNMALVGIPIMIPLLGKIAVLSVAFGNLLMSLLLTPLTIVQLETGIQTQTGQKKMTIVLKSLKQAFRQPLVWAPITALIIAILQIPMPALLQKSLSLLGDATSGIALFAIGLILCGQKLRISPAVLMNVTFKNLIQPLVMWGIALLFGLTVLHRREMILLAALPTAVVPMMLSVKYKIDTTDAEASILLSTILSMITIGIVIVLTS